VARLAALGRANRDGDSIGIEVLHLEACQLAIAAAGF
jgi:hypothetical protein